MDRRFNALIELLLELFDEDGLRQWVRRALGKEVHQALPGRPVALDKLCSELVARATIERVALRR